MSLSWYSCQTCLTSLPFLGDIRQAKSRDILLPIGVMAGTLDLLVDAEKLLRSTKMKINQSGIY